MSKPVSAGQPDSAKQSLQEDKKQHDKKGDNLKPEKAKESGLSEEDIPEASNESKGTTGSGQRQDSN